MSRPTNFAVCVAGTPLMTSVILPSWYSPGTSARARTANCFPPVKNAGSRTVCPEGVMTSAQMSRAKGLPWSDGTVKVKVTGSGAAVAIAVRKGSIQSMDQAKERRREVRLMFAWEGGASLHQQGKRPPAPGASVQILFVHCRVEPALRAGSTTVN